MMRLIIKALDMMKIQRTDRKEVIIFTTQSEHTALKLDKLQQLDRMCPIICMDRDVETQIRYCSFDESNYSS